MYFYSGTRRTYGWKLAHRFSLAVYSLVAYMSIVNLLGLAVTHLKVHKRLKTILSHFRKFQNA